VDKEIKDMSLQEVKTLECGSWFGESWNKEKIPKLNEVLELLPEEKDIFIEVKTNEEVVPILLEVIKKNYKDLDKLTVISFFPEVIKAIKRKESQIKCNLLIAFDYKEMHTQDILNLAMTTKADGIGAQNHERLDEKFIQAVRDIEKTIHVWTVNSNEEAESYYRNGIDSITTNKPLSIRNYLEALE
jgi:glycerophosphoryl diester phosphodiesterase